MKGGLGGLMKQAQLMQESLKRVQSEIAALEVEGSSAAGRVRVRMNGRHEVSRVSLDPGLLAEEREMLEDLIAAAFNDAARRLEAAIQEKMASVTAGMPLPPGVKFPF